MTVVLVIAAVVLLTVGTLVVSRLGAREHQEDLNSPLRNQGPLRDRPAGPGAESTGVQGPGQPGDAAR